MSYLTLKCTFLFIKQRKKLSKKRNAASSSVVNPSVTAIIEIVGLEASNQPNALNGSITGTNSNNASSVPNPPQSPRSQRLYDEQNSPWLQRCFSCMLFCISLLYLVFGLGFSWLVLMHFESSKAQRSNVNSLSVSQLINHPELYLWDQCLYKTYPFQSVNYWSNDINCNCRQARIDLTSLENSFDIDIISKLNDTTNINVLLTIENKFNNSVGCDLDEYSSFCLMTESLLINWNMLETLYILNDNNALFTISLNDSSHYNAIYLKILHFEEIRVDFLGTQVNQWNKLEYLYISHAHFSSWPQNFEQVNKISFLKLEDSYLESLPPNLCDMNNLRGLVIITSLSFSSSDRISQLPDCIVNLNQLQSVIFRFSSMNSLPVGFFSMPSIAEIGIFADDSFGVLAFLDLINQTINASADNSFTWHSKSQTTYLFVDSLFCSQMIRYIYTV